MKDSPIGAPSTVARIDQGVLQYHVEVGSGKIYGEAVAISPTVEVAMRPPDVFARELSPEKGRRLRSIWEPMSPT